MTNGERILTTALRLFNVASVEVSGQEVSVPQMQHGVALMLQVLEPYIVR